MLEVLENITVTWTSLPPFTDAETTGVWPRLSPRSSDSLSSALSTKL